MLPILPVADAGATEDLVEILDKNKGRQVYLIINNQPIIIWRCRCCWLLIDDAADATDVDAAEDPVEIFDMGPTSLFNNSTISKLESANSMIRIQGQPCRSWKIYGVLAWTMQWMDWHATSADEAVEDEPIALEVVCMLIAQTPQVEGVRLFAKRMRKLCSKLVRIERGGWESGGICWMQMGEWGWYFYRQIMPWQWKIIIH